MEHHPFTARRPMRNGRHAVRRGPDRNTCCALPSAGAGVAGVVSVNNSEGDARLSPVDHAVASAVHIATSSVRSMRRRGDESRSSS